MSDEIDIEEHDLLDNPAVRRIFPDLSIIKKEISQYEDFNEGFGASIEETTFEAGTHSEAEVKLNIHQDIESVTSMTEESIPKTKPRTYTNKRLEVHLRFKRFLDSLDDDNDDCSIDVQSHTFSDSILSSPKKVSQTVKHQNTEPGNTEAHSNTFNENNSNTEFQNIALNDNNLLRPKQVGRTVKSQSMASANTIIHSNTVSDGITNREFQSDTINGSVPSRPKKVSEFVKFLNTKSVKEETKPSFKNVFIIGSKPNVEHPQIKITEKKQLKLTLKNIGSYLKGSKQYCKQCLILFPNVNALKCHIDLVHTHRPNDSSEKNLKLKQSKLKLKSQCEICKVTLCSKGNLVRHLKTVHKNSKSNKLADIIKSKRSTEVNTKIFKTRNLSLQNMKEKSSKNHNCFHCDKKFESKSSLIEHLYDVLNPNKTSHNDATKSKGTENQDSVVDKSNKDISNTECNKSSLKPLTRNKIDQTVHSDTQKPGTTSKRLMKSKLLNNDLKRSRLDEPTESNKISSIKKGKVSTEKRRPSKSDDYNCLDLQSRDYSDSLEASDNDNQNVVENTTINIQKKEVYQCYICSKYMIYWKRYSIHMNGHNVKDVLAADTVAFDTKCKFCDVKNLYAMKSYNRHISQFHREKMCKRINLDKKALRSVLFKCVKCNVSFLTANAAKNHSDHKAIFLNWRCLDCHRLFKIKDRAAHLKQHLLSKNITIYVLGPSALNRVLYKCLKCTVHFSETEYFLHSTKCDLETPNSTYCNTCDILVNRNDMDLHEHNHKDTSSQGNNFTLIESDVIMNVKEQRKEKQNRHSGSKFALTFCSTCNCYLGNLGRKRKSHIEGRCGIINPRMCRKCGLTFTSRGYLSHKMLHSKVKNLNMQSFYFYDIKTKKQMRPPLPKYPYCTMCDVHFLSKKAIRQHLCTKLSSTTCHQCKIHLTSAAFKLHVNFHNYKLSATVLSKKRPASLENAITSTTNSNTIIPKTIPLKNEVNPKRDTSVLQEKEISSSEVEEPVTSTSSNNDVSNICAQDSISNVSLKANMYNSPLLFTCVLCKLTFDIYDKVVEHCHDHYDYKENLSSEKNSSSIEQIPDNSATKINFDPFYIRFDKEIWLKHIFENLTEEHIIHILEHSKYKFEYRLKLEEVQPGLPSVDNSILYKCDKCRSYIDPNEIYAHASAKCTFARNHPCSTCGLCFFSENYKNIHEQTHESSDINSTSYKIILFNKLVHQEFIHMMVASRNKFILYQCRNCDVIIDKLKRHLHKCRKTELSKCTRCGLLFHEEELELHTTRHELINDFRTETMIVVMFGKLESKRDDEPKSFFTGRVYDLTFYKCSNCGLCSESKSSMYKHICVSKSQESQCLRCNLCLLPKRLKEHYQLHENNLELDSDDFNSNIITFTKSTGYVNDSLNQNLSEVNKASNANDLNENLMQKLYRCRCGLHFLEELNGKKHLYNCNPRMKISKQSCFKCDLLFTPGELFDHLLKHHSNKKIHFKYDIINMSEGDGNN